MFEASEDLSAYGATRYQRESDYSFSNPDDIASRLMKRENGADTMSFNTDFMEEGEDDSAGGHLLKSIMYDYVRQSYPADSLNTLDSTNNSASGASDIVNSMKQLYVSDSSVNASSASEALKSSTANAASAAAPSQHIPVAFYPAGEAPSGGVLVNSSSSAPSTAPVPPSAPVSAVAAVSAVPPSSGGVPSATYYIPHSSGAPVYVDQNGHYYRYSAPEVVYASPAEAGSPEAIYGYWSQEQGQVMYGPGPGGMDIRRMYPPQYPYMVPPPPPGAAGTAPAGAGATASATPGVATPAVGGAPLTRSASSSDADYSAGAYSDYRPELVRTNSDPSGGRYGAPNGPYYPVPPIPGAHPMIAPGVQQYPPHPGYGQVPGGPHYPGAGQYPPHPHHPHMPPHPHHHPHMPPPHAPHMHPSHRNGGYGYDDPTDRYRDSYRDKSDRGNNGNNGNSNNGSGRDHRGGYHNNHHGHHHGHHSGNGNSNNGSHHHHHHNNNNNNNNSNNSNNNNNSNSKKSPVSPTTAGSNPVRDPLVDEFRNTYGKSRQWSLRDLMGHVVAFCQDQHGSRFIQQKLEVCSDPEKQLIFDEIIPVAGVLMTDVFGNYVLQKLFEFGTSEQCDKLSDLLIGQSVTLSMQMYGCRVVQKALEYVSTSRLVQLVSEFEDPDTLLLCVHDANGNHVIQKCIEIVSKAARDASGNAERSSYLNSRIQFIIDAFRGRVKELSSHPYGCRVVQRILEHCSNPQKTVILEELRQCFSDLVQDCYGNYVIQFVMQHGWEVDRNMLMKDVQTHLLDFSQHKFASNVVEKCLQFANKKDRDEMIWKIINVVTEQVPATNINMNNGENGRSQSVLEAMVRDPYANYVVQKVIDMSDDKQRAAILKYVKDNISQLRRYTYGKHIILRLEKITNEKF